MISQWLKAWSTLHYGMLLCSSHKISRQQFKFKTINSLSLFSQNSRGTTFLSSFTYAAYLSEREEHHHHQLLQFVKNPMMCNNNQLQITAKKFLIKKLCQLCRNKRRTMSFFFFCYLSIPGTK